MTKSKFDNLIGLCNGFCNSVLHNAILDYSSCNGSNFFSFDFLLRFLVNLVIDGHERLFFCWRLVDTALTEKQQHLSANQISK